MFRYGYLAILLGFGALATLGQWALHAASLVWASAVTTSSMVGGTLLSAAGIYQWLPLNHACLAHCRSPLDYLMTGWRIGAEDAIWGSRTAFCCTGGCWLLMALLFVDGVMNLMWIAIRGVFVLTEKIMPKGFWFARGTGPLSGCGVWMIAAMYGALNL